VVVEVVSNMTISVSWDPPDRPNGILLTYTVRVHNRLSGFADRMNVLPSNSQRRVEMSDLGKITMKAWVFAVMSLVYLCAI